MDIDLIIFIVIASLIIIAIIIGFANRKNG